MNNLDVQRDLSSCDSDLVRIKNIIEGIGVTSNIVPYLNKYAIVRACGAIEVGFKTIVADCVSNGSNSQVKNFIDSRIRDSSMNPRYELILKTVEQFDENWKQEFKKRIKDHPRKDKILASLDSLVECRNEFAHGGNPNKSIDDVIAYFSDSKLILEILDEVVV